MVDNTYTVFVHSWQEDNMDKQMARLRQQWLKKNGISRRWFAEMTGQEIGTVHAWFSRGSTSRAPYLKAILKVFPKWPHRKP